MKKRNYLLGAILVFGLTAAGCAGSRQQTETVQTTQEIQTAGSDEITASGPRNVTDTKNTDGTGSAAGSANAEIQEGTEQITEEEAKNAALADAGYKENQVSGMRIKLDREDGRWVYEIEFYVQAEEYDYEIDAATGAILSRDYDIDDDYLSSSSAGIEGLISEEEAIAIVLKRVEGASGQDVRIKLEQDDGRWKYEGDLVYNQREYEFELNAQTGEILEWSEETY